MPDCRIHVEPLLFPALALLLLVLPLNWICAIVCSSIFHELCHLAALRLSGGTVSTIRIGLDGVYIHTSTMLAAKDLFCSLAGPLGGLILLLFSRWFPRVAVCALFQSAYHLLPLYPLDGGRAFRSLVEWLRIPYGDRIWTGVEAVTMTLLALLGSYMTVVLKLGLLPLLLSAAVIFRVCREKFLANRAGKGYNISTI